MKTKPTLEDARQSATMGPQRVEYFQKVFGELKEERNAYYPSAELKMIQQLIVIVRMAYEELEVAVEIIDRLEAMTIDTKKNVEGVYSSRSNI